LGFSVGIVRKFVTKSVRMMIATVNDPAATGLVSDLGTFAQMVDVPDATSVAEMATAIADIGSLDILVNNAGTTHLPKPMEEVAEDEFDHVFAVNAKLVFLNARAFVPEMKARDSGAILTVGSTVDLPPWTNINLVHCRQVMDDHGD